MNLSCKEIYKMSCFRGAFPCIATLLTVLIVYLLSVY